MTQAHPRVLIEILKFCGRGVAEVYCFGRFTLDPATRRLSADGVPVSLGALDLRLLLVLIESAGVVVTKDDLMSRVWGRAIVGDHVLHVHIDTLRKVLGDDCIMTKRGCGYRFVAPVEQRDPDALPRPLPSRAGNLALFGSRHTAEGSTRLIGRSDQLRLLSDLLAQSRLVTLMGPGGVGKTRLALHASSDASLHVPDGVWLVELAGLSNPELLPGAITAALGIQVGINATPLDALTRHLVQKSLLIVLDNCENVIAACGQIVEAILAAAPQVKVLATSREALSCFGEQVLNVPPLAVPGEGTMSPAAIRSVAAIELFIERATEADAGFRVEDCELPIVARICRRLDGLPLAIEMAAGWAGVLGLQTLDEKLNGSLRNWLQARSTAPPRHSTLRATLEWSYGLLSSDEKTVLCRLAVFAGGFTMGAAEAVAGDTSISSNQILGHVANLVRKSMIAVVPDVGERRYRLLETTRAFMLEQPEASSTGHTIRQRHARHVLCVLESAKREWETTSDADWRERYIATVDDLRDAFDWAMREDSDDAVALAGASWLLLRELSLGAEARERLTAAEARVRPGTPADVEARLRHGLGVMLLNTPAMKAAHQELERTATLYRTMGDSPYLGSALIALGYASFMLDRIEQAEREIAEALRLLENSGWLRTLATAYYVRMHIEAAFGRFNSADRAHEEAARLCEIAGAERAGLNLSADKMQVILQSGDIDGAISTGRSLAARLRDTPHIDIRGYALGVFAVALTARCDLEEALATAREAAPLLRDDGRLFWLFDHLALRAGLAGQKTDAALLAGYANAVHENSGRLRDWMGRRAVERTNSLLRDTLAEDRIAQFGSLGAQLSEEQALKIALM